LATTNKAVKKILKFSTYSGPAKEAVNAADEDYRSDGFSIREEPFLFDLGVEGKFICVQTAG
jgi:hypothetical protein